METKNERKDVKNVSHTFFFSHYVSALRQILQAPNLVLSALSAPESIWNFDATGRVFFFH